MKTSVLMTDPRFYAIRGGANPHTRNPDNSLKKVDIEAAMPQWHDYVDALLDGGISVYVAEPEETLTGMVFAANAGFLDGRLDDRPSTEKTFYPSHFTAQHRIGETEVFKRFMSRFGFDVGDYPKDRRFEGEADAFPIGRGADQLWVFTSAFRSDPVIADWLEQEVVGEEMLRLKLTDPKYYHGDTVLCDLGGPAMGYPGGLRDTSWDALRANVDELIELSDADAQSFIANSFYAETDGDRLLYTPAEISERTRGLIEEFGIDVVPVDISEFFIKGGGGPKCMVFNLGRVGIEEDTLSDAQREFRRSRHVEILREQGHFDDV